MTYMTSSAAVGSASVTVYFRQGINADMAAVNVQNRISRATGQLPSEVTQIGVTTMKRQTSMVKIFSLYSPDVYKRQSLYRAAAGSPQPTTSACRCRHSGCPEYVP